MVYSECFIVKINLMSIFCELPCFKFIFVEFIIELNNSLILQQ